MRLVRRPLCAPRLPAFLIRFFGKSASCSEPATKSCSRHRPAESRVRQHETKSTPHEILWQSAMHTAVLFSIRVRNPLAREFVLNRRKFSFPASAFLVF